MSVNANLDVNETVINAPEVWLQFNADGDLIYIRKRTVSGRKYVRKVRDQGITDFVIASTMKFEKYQLER